MIRLRKVFSGNAVWGPGGTVLPTYVGLVAQLHKNQGSARAARANTLANHAWLCILEEEVLAGGLNEPIRAGGRRIREADARALHRWRREGCCPTIWRADEFLTYYLGGGGLDRYFVFCERNNLWPWAAPQAPEWLS